MDLAAISKVAKGKPMREFYKALIDMVECRASCDEICGTISLDAIPVQDPGGIIPTSRASVAILQAAQALVRTVPEGQTRASLAASARKDILDAKIAIPMSLMSLLEDPRRIHVEQPPST